MRLFRLVLLTATVALVGLAGASSASAITASSDFTDDADGWTLYDGGHLPAERHPGGFLTFSDPETGTGNEEYFASPAKYRGDATRNYGGTFSYDQRTSTTPNSPPGSLILLIDLESSSRGALAFADQVEDEWDPHSFTLTEDNFVEYLGDGAGQTPTQEEFRTILAGLDSVFILADASSEAGEQTDIDNVAMTNGPDNDGDGHPNGLDSCPNVAAPTRPDGCPAGNVDRNLTLRYNSTTDEFRGLLSLVDPSDPAACVRNEVVRVYREVAGPDAQIGTDRTDSEGRYFVPGMRRTGRTYYAKAPASSLPDGTCKLARSPDLLPPQ